MTRTLAALTVGLFAIATSACNRSPEGGTPGQTFRLTTAAGDTNLKPGEEKTVVVNVSRDSSFTQPVTVKADSQSPKIDVRVDKTKLETADKSFTLTVKAAADAPKGEHIIKVTGTPQTGTPTNLEVRVEVVNP
jgi:uncharacterized membrane protein